MLFVITISILYGLRKAKGKDYVPAEGEEKKGEIGLGNSVPATCFPPAATSSCSWDEDLLKQEGKAMGQECLKEKVSTILGPGTNIKRAPVCGRNFEYFSEDPYLAGKCSASVINGVQSKGVGTSLKHFACNSQETLISGTSVASAYVSGTAALLLSQNPKLTPVDIKEILIENSHKINDLKSKCKSKGIIDVSASFQAGMKYKEDDK